MRVKLLGPIEVIADGRPRPVNGVRRRTLLAVLALHAGEVVGADRLIDIAWGEAATVSVRLTLQSHISKLRRTLGPAIAIRSCPPGYLLELDGDGTDVQAAERLIRQGIAAADPAQAIPLLQEAVELWRGPALADITESAWTTGQAQRLDAMLLQARATLIDRRLALGEGVGLLPELVGLSREHPLDEHLHGQLMYALYRAGRQADALATFERLRLTLHDELGIGPGPTLCELHQAILRQDEALDLGVPLIEPGLTAVDRRPGPVNARPAQLPTGLASFVGRVAEVDQLTTLLAPHADPQKFVLAVVSGTAGVGKTALVVHWAHQVAERFPDGQLYVNLRGVDPGRPPLPPADAVCSFLEALGAQAYRIPTDLDGQAALYRTLLSNRRVLVILDNAHDAEQVRPLLPGASGCAVVVTSRDQLIGLIANEGAHPISLDLLTVDEARQMTARRLGPERVRAEPEAADRIINACARLPLALAVATAYASRHPRFRLAAVADALCRSSEPLDAFGSTDAASDVRSVLSWSYRALDTQTARVFRLLGLHPGNDIAVAAVASLAGIDQPQAHSALTELAKAHLLTEYPPGRYSFHDLLRAYANELVHLHDDDNERDDATRRLLDYYLYSAHAAATTCFGPWAQVPLEDISAGVAVERPGTQQHAMAWLNAEQQVLLAGIEHAAPSRCAGHGWRLAWILAGFLRQHYRLLDWAKAARSGLVAAHLTGDAEAIAYAHHGLGRAYNWLGSHGKAHRHLYEAMRRFTDLEDNVNLGQVQLNIGGLWHRRRDYTRALQHATQALALFRAAAHRAGHAEALSAVGWSYAQLGNFTCALAFCQQALELHQAAGDRLAQAGTWDSLGYIHHGLADPAQAIACYTAAASIFHHLEERYNEADTCTRLAQTQVDAGDYPSAQAAWLRALTILEDLGHPDASQVRDQLARLTALTST